MLNLLSYNLIPFLSSSSIHIQKSFSDHLKKDAVFPSLCLSTWVILFLPAFRLLFCNSVPFLPPSTLFHYFSSALLSLLFTLKVIKFSTNKKERLFDTQVFI